MIDTSMYGHIDWSKPQSWRDAAQIIGSLAESMVNADQDENISYELESIAIDMRRMARQMDKNE